MEMTQIQQNKQWPVQYNNNNSINFFSSFLPFLPLSVVHNVFWPWAIVTVKNINNNNTKKSVPTSLHAFCDHSILHITERITSLNDTETSASRNGVVRCHTPILAASLNHLLGLQGFGRLRRHIRDDVIACCPVGVGDLLVRCTATVE